MNKPGAMKLRRTPDAVAYSVDHFRRWLFEADRYSVCLFYVGHIAVDQTAHPHVLHMSQFVSLMVEFNLVTTTQHRADEGLYQYLAIRTSRRAEYAPKRVTLGTVDIQTYRCLDAIAKRDAVTTVAHAVRNEVGREASVGDAALKDLQARGLIETGYDPKITKAGWRALA